MLPQPISQPIPQPITSFDPVSHDLLVAAVNQHCAIVDASVEMRLGLPLPEPVASHLRRLSDNGTRFNTDRNSMQNAFEKRKREFSVGRLCAQHALRQLSITAEVPVDHDRKPIWPEGVVGSISHSDRYAWAVAARQSCVRHVGIDTEIIVDDETFENVVDEIAVEAEMKLLSKIHRHPTTAFTILFSAKESIYKCLYPSNEQYFGFHDVRLIDATETSVTFAQQPSNPNFATAPKHLTVRYLVVQRDVFTSIWV